MAVDFLFEFADGHTGVRELLLLRHVLLVAGLDLFHPVAANIQQHGRQNHGADRTNDHKGQADFSKYVHVLLPSARSFVQNAAPLLEDKRRRTPDL